MKSKYTKYIDYALLLLGGIVLFFEQGKESGGNVYILIGALMVFMYGLYKVTSIWVKDNPRPPKKDEYVPLEDDDANGDGHWDEQKEIDDK